MSLGVPYTPVSVEQLYAALLARGFAVVAERRGGTGGLEMVVRGSVDADSGPADVDVKIAADRGHWSVEVRAGGMADFIDPRVWIGYLDATAVGDPDVDRQAAFASDRLADAVDAVHTRPDVEAALVRLGKDDMLRRYPRLSEIRWRRPDRT